MDFTPDKYGELLDAMTAAGFAAVLRFVSDKDDSRKQILLRHDVDLRPDCALRIAHIEAEKGLRAIYYFRTVQEGYDEHVIKEIASLGHEIGYHYESLTTCCGDIDAAYQDFCDNLHRMNDLLGIPVKTICMHGSPRSPYDSRDLWKHYDYRALGVDFEPYIDTDFSKTFYLTDTGRRWDGYKVSVRDKIPQYQDQWTALGLVFHSTNDIIKSLISHSSPIDHRSSPDHPQPSSLNPQPSSILLTTHPQRWIPLGRPWLQEYLFQTAKNVVKSCVVVLGRGQ